MKTENLNQIAEFFVNLYSDELNELTPDAISEWWSMNWSNWVEENNIKVYNEVEKAIISKIKQI